MTTLPLIFDSVHHVDILFRSIFYRKCKNGTLFEVECDCLDAHDIGSGHTLTNNMETNIIYVYRRLNQKVLRICLHSVILPHASNTRH